MFVPSSRAFFPPARLRRAYRPPRTHPEMHCRPLAAPHRHHRPIRRSVVAPRVPVRERYVRVCTWRARPPLRARFPPSPPPAFPFSAPRRRSTDGPLHSGEGRRPVAARPAIYTDGRARDLRTYATATVAVSACVRALGGPRTGAQRSRGCSAAARHYCCGFFFSSHPSSRLSRPRSSLAARTAFRGTDPTAMCERPTRARRTTLPFFRFSHAHSSPLRSAFSRATTGARVARVQVPVRADNLRPAPFAVRVRIDSRLTVAPDVSASSSSSS